MDNEWHVLGLGNDRSTIFAGSTGDDQLLLDPSDRLPGLGGPHYPIALEMQGSNLLDRFMLSGAIGPLDVTVANNGEVMNVLDLDGNGVAEASDGIMAARLASGLTGDAVTLGAVADNATRGTPEEIQAFYEGVRPFLDVDGNGVVGTFSDIVMILRVLTGVRGDAVTSGAVAEDATRTDPGDIEAYIGLLQNFPTEDSPAVVEVSPANGEEMVNLTRETVVGFGEKVDPATVNDESFFLIANGERVGGRIDVSSTEEFATFFYDESLPASTEVRVVVEGDAIIGRDGNAIDGDGDGNPGGTLRADFRTLPLTRIEGTDVSGFVFDSFNTNADGSNIPVVGATIRVDAFPEANGITDENGFFLLEDVPAPVFSVHIDGSTADNAPEGTVYATVGKLFESVPGQETQLSMDGEPFDVFLPPLATGDIQELSETEDTDVGFGDAGVAQLQALFPDVDASVWERTRVTFPAGSAQDEDGNAATQAAIIPVAPDRLPAPLPAGIEPQLVISIQAGGDAGFSQAGGATNFDVPAPVSFPNVDGLAPGEQSLIWSFNHDSGDWEVVGMGTVSDDGLSVVSDPGVGILAPGWHFTNPGARASGGGVGTSVLDCLEEEIKNFAENYVSFLLSFSLALPPFSTASAAARSQGLGSAFNFITTVLQALPGLARNQDNRAKSGLIIANSGINFSLSEFRYIGPTYSRLAQADGLFKPFQGILDSLRNYIQCLSDFLDGLLPQPMDGSNVPRQPPFNGNNIAEDQLRLWQEIGEVYDNIFGSPKWTRVEPERLDLVFHQDIFTAIRESLQEFSPGRERIIQEERELILELPRPSNITREDLVALLDRLDRMVAGELSADEIDVDAMLQSATRLQQTLSELEEEGWETRSDLFTRGITEMSAVADDILGSKDIVESNLFYRVTNLTSGFISRGRLGSDGDLENLVLTPNTFYYVEYADPLTLQTAVTVFQTGANGSNVEIPRAILTDADPVDTDDDGLPDRLEEIIGTISDNADTDGDGINDFAELQQGLDPLGGRAFPTGIISSLPLQGEAKAVVVEGSPLDAQDQTAYVATGSHGLAIVDASQFDNPIVLGQLDLPGDATDLAVDANLQIAAVATNDGGLQLVDVSDPMLPTTSSTLNISANQVEIADGIAYATVGSTLRAVDLLTGEELQSLTIPGSGTVTGLSREGTKLYGFTSGSDTFSVIDITNEGAASVQGQVNLSVASSQVGVFAGNGVAYLAGSGLRTIDVSDPSTPTSIGDAAQFFTAREIALNGSGLALVTAQDQGLGIYDVMDPQDTDALVTQVDTPGSASDVAIASGIAYVADDASGLQVINYLPFDNQGVAPTVAIGTSADVDPNTSGIQVVEGSSISITADVVDDVQVRNVELLVNGEVVGNDVSFPFDLAAVAPNIVAEVNTADIQVRATDTGGNSTLSNVLTLDLLEDTFAPEVVSTTPTDGSSQIGVSSITVRFNEAIDTSLVDLSGMTLTNLGIDGVLGGGDDSTVNLNAVEIPSSRRLTIFLEDLPDEGQYQLEIDSSIIADRAGNFIEAPFTLEFASSNIFTFTDFTDLSAFSLNGVTSAINSTPVFFNEKNVLRLTNGSNQGGSAFLIEPIPIEIQGSDASFSTAFQFQLTDSAGISDGDGSGADGFTFAISSNPSAIGVIGGGIGYSGISPSVAVEFDTFGRFGENGNHVGVNLNGSLDSIAMQPVATRMNNGAVWYTWIDYNGENNLLEVRLSETETRPDTALLSETIDIVDTLGQPEAFIGFTSATGGASNDHDIRFWEFQIIS